MSLCWCRRWRLFRISSISRPFFVLTADALSIDRYFITARIQNRQHSTKRSFPNIQNIDAANKLVSTLNDSERLLLRQGLLDFDQGQGSTATRSAVVATATAASASVSISMMELRGVFLYSALPFIGFGFLDNAIMILAGEYIDVTLGVALGISTMAAAALGNIVSDVAGIGFAGYVEVFSSKVGVHAPPITFTQTLLWQTRSVVGLGRCIGLILGCLIGMFPLLFFNNESDADDRKKMADEGC